MPLTAGYGLAFAFDATNESEFWKTRIERENGGCTAHVCWPERLRAPGLLETGGGVICQVGMPGFGGVRRLRPGVEIDSSSAGKLNRQPKDTAGGLIFSNSLKPFATPVVANSNSRSRFSRIPSYSLNTMTVNAKASSLRQMRGNTGLRVPSLTKAKSQASLSSSNRDVIYKSRTPHYPQRSVESSC
eukprot:CAMPEP_0119314872 /NCGR_PEP_ID=MMETSP1333-20130426/34077_1 /TAXON_ID=418940 /ORGANISM="Scyphosphaera apsteinii, Strain RCC1455" /LENGTH=186 /DNA_ID=CAMNT_0007320071 /DNA_START=192 /DNA_END=752 /DNA_ORIENTATION=+